MGGCFKLNMLYFTMLLYFKFQYKSRNIDNSMQYFAQSFADVKVCCKT